MVPDTVSQTVPGSGFAVTGAESEFRTHTLYGRAWEGATAVELRGAWFQRRQQRGITRAWLHVDLDVIDQAVMPAD